MSLFIFRHQAVRCKKTCKPPCFILSDLRCIQFPCHAAVPLNRSRQRQYRKDRSAEHPFEQCSQKRISPAPSESCIPVPIRTRRKKYGVKHTDCKKKQYHDQNCQASVFPFSPLKSLPEISRDRITDKIRPSCHLFHRCPPVSALTDTLWISFSDHTVLF